MKQVLQNMRTGETSVTEVPIPTPRPGTALVRTCASLVSAGTERSVVEFASRSMLGKARSRPDLVRQVLDKARREGLLSTGEAVFNRLDDPLALGYASSGVIAGLGADMAGFTIGQRVACAGGNYAVHAEFALVPRNLLAPLPDDLDFESASFATLAAIALHGFRLGKAQVGENVAVIGLGVLGLLAAQIAKGSGCRVLGIDLDESRLEKARFFGISSALREEAAEAARSFTSGRGIDLTLICAGDPSPDAVTLAGEMAREGGRVVAVGVVSQDLPRPLYYQKELTFTTSRSYGPGRYDPAYEEGGQDYPYGYVRWTEGRNLSACVDLMASGQVEVKSLISHRFPIDQAVQAYDLITGKTKEPSLGVLLTYPDTPPSITPTRLQLRAARTTTETSVRLGVLGAGQFAGATLLPAVRRQKGLELAGIASPGGLHAVHAARRFGFVYAASSQDEVLDDPNINALAILTRHDSHVPLTLRGLQAGKHVFVEKPLAVNAQQLAEVQTWLEEHAIGAPLLTVGFNRRFAPFVIRLKKFFANRHEPMHIHYRVNAGVLPLTHWQHDPTQGGGRIIGEACHFVDLLTFLVGELPMQVSSLGLPENGLSREDQVSMTFKFPDGSMGMIDYLSNGDKAFPKERVEVFCGGRVAALDDFRSLELVKDGSRRVFRSFLKQDKGHFNEWKVFLAAIRSGGPAPIPYEQLLGVSRATLAAVESLRSGRKVELV